MQFSDSLGFTLRSSRGSFSEATVGRVSDPTQSRKDTLFNQQEKRDSRLQNLIKKAITAYTVDGIIRAAVDKYAELFKGFSLEGAPDAVNYVKNRLSVMALQTGETWEALLARIVAEYFKTGNVFIVKVRQNHATYRAQRPLYEAKPHPIAGLFLISPDRLDPEFENGLHIGWKLNDTNRSSEEKMKLVLPGSVGLSKSKALIKAQRPASPGVFRNGMDIVHLAYKKGGGSVWGVGLTLPVLEDVALLRNVEQSVATLIKKNIFPIIHHKLIKPPNPTLGNRSNLEEIVGLHRRAAPDGVLITGPDHEVKAIGSESHALRAEGYLIHFTNRVFAGLGLSPTLMGFGTSTIGTAETARSTILTKAKFVQGEIKREIEWWIFNEILWEGGFDPYRNEKDRVVITFDEIDKEGLIKHESHILNLWQGNLIGMEEAREKMKLSPQPKSGTLYLDRIQLPLAKAKAQAGVGSSGNPNNPTTRIKNSEELIDLVHRILPKSEDEVDDCLRTLEQAGCDSEAVRALSAPVKNLIHDSEAVFTLMVSTLSPLV